MPSQFVEWLSQNQHEAFFFNFLHIFKFLSLFATHFFIKQTNTIMYTFTNKVNNGSPQVNDSPMASESILLTPRGGGSSTSASSIKFGIPALPAAPRKRSREEFCTPSEAEATRARLFLPTFSLENDNDDDDDLVMEEMMENKHLQLPTLQLKPRFSTGYDSCLHLLPRPRLLSSNKCIDDDWSLTGDDDVSLRSDCSQ